MAILAVIFDLDGTLLDTETVCYQVGQKVVRTHGKELTKDAARLGIGKRPLECWAAIADALGITKSPQELVDQSEPELRDRWPHVKMLPGARRLLHHLSAHRVPLAVATSTSRESLQLKLMHHADIYSLCKVIVCGDEVVDGKPNAEIYNTVASQLGVLPEQCLVIEDAPSGIEAAQAAGMAIVGVPSLVEKHAYTRCGCKMLASLLDFRPEEYGLPPFEDYVHGTVRLDMPWTLKGEVVKGFGRGSKDLGIPTANISANAIGSSLSDAVTGIYYGWASVGVLTAVHMMVMSVGYNPFYGNTTKTCEPWLLEDFDQDFYGQELRLLVCGYVRPEADFTTLKDLKERIHQDAAVTRSALAQPELHELRSHSFLHNKAAEHTPSKVPL